MKTIHTIAAALAWIAISAGMAGAQDRITMPFSDPSRPGTLVVDILTGSITVEGYEGAEVEIQAAAGRRSETPRPPERAAGMRRIVSASTGLSVEERNNVMTIETDVRTRPSNLIIRVPVSTSLRLETLAGGDVSVSNVRSEIEVENNNGAIRLDRVSGSAVAHALNGEIQATFDGVTANAPMSFSTLNGDIDVTLPASVRATVRMKTENGEIYTDFELTLDGSSPGRIDESRRGRNRARFDRAMTGTINGGGAEIQLTTLNGNIYIRKGN